MTLPQSHLLRVTLSVNAAFSLLTGVTLLLGGAQIVPWLGNIPQWLVTSLGGMLLMFAVLIVFIVCQIRPARALGIVTLDIGWLVCTVPLIFVPGLLTDPGKVAVLIVALLVGGLAVAQLVGIRLMLCDPVRGRGEYRHCIRVHVAAPAQAMWETIADLGGISRFSPALVTSTLRDGARPGVGTIRVCTNTSSHTWSEVCEIFDLKERRLEVRFLTNEPGFPYPAKVMFGGWNVQEDGEGSTVEVWWSITPTLPLGWLIVTLMGLRIDGDFAAMISRMAEVAQGRPLPEVPPKLTPAFCS
ncbi:MAG: SRPBCC family protein [Candidatus Competibacteraceae bacterium]|jgi:hypothetical protein|nr:SRPBCC family protein [Candidatus Competibacteraceae bacterium]